MEEDKHCCKVCNEEMVSESGENEENKWKCSKCNKSYCTKCECEWHDNSSCEKYQEWKKDMENEEEKYKEYISKFCRPCPNCQVQIEKNKGCQWMHCSHCKCYFCWKCMNISNDHQHIPGTVCEEWKC